jgi:hypothetical protein
LAEKIDACQVAARAGEAGDETKPDRVFAGDEDDRDRRGRRRAARLSAAALVDGMDWSRLYARENRYAPDPI